MRIRSLALVAALAALPALAQNNPAARPTVPPTGPSPTSGSDAGPFKPGNPVLNPVEAPRLATPEPSSVVMQPPMTTDDVLLAEIAERHRVDQYERQMDRVERENERAAARAATLPPPVAPGAWNGSTDPRDR